MIKPDFGRALSFYTKRETAGKIHIFPAVIMVS